MPRRLPDLPDTGRHYLDGTQRARLASPGIERYVPERGKGARWAVLVALVVAVLAAGAWLANR